MNLKTFAAVDIGSNAARLQISVMGFDGQELHNIKDEYFRVPLRLGIDVFENNIISETKKKKFITTMCGFKNLIDVYEPVEYKAYATASLRAAENGPEIIKEIIDTCGLKVEIISGNEEAELIYTNIIAHSTDNEHNYLCIEVGGGSTEISLFSKGQVVFSESFEIGTIRWLKEKISIATWNSYKDTIRSITKDYQPLIAIASGGNINKIHKILEKKSDRLTISRLKEFYEDIKPLSLEERMDKWDLSSDRADVIVPAAKIFLSTAKCANIQELVIPKIGLVDGITNMLANKHFNLSSSKINK